MEMSCSGMFGAGDGSQIAPPNQKAQFLLQQAEVAVVDRAVQKLLIDFEVIVDLAKVSPKTGGKPTKHNGD